MQNNLADKPKTTSTKGIAALFKMGWISSNMVFFFYIAFLAIVYIAYGHWTDKTVRNINKTETKLRDLQFEYKTIKGEVMKESEVKNVEEKAQKLGLKMSTEMPLKLIKEVKEK